MTCFPKYILTKDFRVLKFQKLLENREGAEYKSITKLTSYRTSYEIIAKPIDLLYIGIEHNCWLKKE